MQKWQDENTSPKNKKKEIKDIKFLSKILHNVEDTIEIYQDTFNFLWFNTYLFKHVSYDHK